MRMALSLLLSELSVAKSTVACGTQTVWKETPLPGEIEYDGVQYLPLALISRILRSFFSHKLTFNV